MWDTLAILLIAFSNATIFREAWCDPEMDSRQLTARLYRIMAFWCASFGLVLLTQYGHPALPGAIGSFVAGVVALLLSLRRRALS